jgi:hypothetical protein
VGRILRVDQLNRDDRAATYVLAHLDAGGTPGLREADLPPLDARVGFLRRPASASSPQSMKSRAPVAWLAL